jgi:hypothetical protein
MAGDQVAEETAPPALEGTAAALHHTSGRWLPLSWNGIQLFNPASVAVTRYRYRGAIPTPWVTANHT